MTERKLLAVTLVVMTGTAVLTGMGTYGFLTDSESIGITFSGNVAGNEAGNAPAPSTGNTATEGPDGAGNQNAGKEGRNTPSGTAFLPAKAGDIGLFAEGRDR